MSVNLRYSWIFKLGCASMFALIGIGAKFGHKGKLEDDQAALFNKAQFYHLINSIILFIKMLDLFAAHLWQPPPFHLKLQLEDLSVEAYYLWLPCTIYL